MDKTTGFIRKNGHSPTAMWRAWVSAWLVCLTLTMTAWGQDAEPAPSAVTAPATNAAAAVDGELQATITGVEGRVQVRETEAAEWQEATVGMVLGPGAEFRTGPRSAVRFTIPPAQTITLDRLGVVKVVQAIREQGRIKTDLGMTYGRTRYDVEAGGVEHEAAIRTPTATLAVRGTRVNLIDDGLFPTEARSLTGRAQLRGQRNKPVPFGSKAKPKAQPVRVAVNDDSAAKSARNDSVTDPSGTFTGRTPEEIDALERYPELGGQDLQGALALRDLVIRGGFEGTVVGVPEVPGPLTIELFWFDSGSFPTGVELQVRDPNGEIASRDNPVIGESASTEGVFSGDPTSTAGQGAQSVVWGAFFPGGQFKIDVKSDEGNGESVQIFVLVTKQGESVKEFGTGTPINLAPGGTFTGNANVGP